MPTLKELMGDLKRGDGRRFFSNSMLIANELFFEPIYKDHYDVWYGLDDRANSDYFPQNDADDWEPYIVENETIVEHHILGGLYGDPLKLIYKTKMNINPKKKVTLYRPIVKERENYLLYDRYCNNKDLFHGHVVGWQEMEVEVDE